MRAVTVRPLEPDSILLENVDEPPPSDGAILVQTVAIGICGTDHEIIAGKHGAAPPGSERLILGHESVGKVLSAPSGTGFVEGDWVVGIVRRPDPVPCENCAIGEWDMCRNRRYTERGIKAIDGFASERFRSDPEFLVRTDPALGYLNVLIEPASVIAKAWEHIEHIGQRATWRPERVLVTGAGPIGLLAALAAVQRGLEVHVIDRVEEGAKPDIVRALGAQYHTGSVKESVAGVDVIVECTGAAALLFDVIEVANPDGIVCLTGLAPAGNPVRVDAASLNREIVLENNVVFGSVNANRRHYEAAAASLAQADRGWLSRMVNRRVELADWSSAYERQPDDIKTILMFDGAADHRWR
jgi:threonine dehydrogenase-like Zn-dependent dehydrogenase